MFSFENFQVNTIKSRNIVTLHIFLTVSFYNVCIFWEERRQKLKITYESQSKNQGLSLKRAIQLQFFRISENISQQDLLLL